MDSTSIEWTHMTFSPWWGCTRVSPGCEHCYAEAFAQRLGMDLWGPTAPRRFFDDRHWHQPVLWNRRRGRGDPRHLVFCTSMADPLEDDRRLDGSRARLWTLIEETPALTWQLLTKRPENADKLTPRSWAENGWPSNVWAMVTAEDQQRADERVPRLLQIPAAVRGVSYEPALGPLRLEWEWLMGSEALAWLIVGGESGYGARPMDVAWAQSTRDQCREAGVAFFMKQDSGPRPGMQGRIPDDLWAVKESPA